MVTSATHSRFASHRRSPLAPAAEHSHRADPLGAHLAAAAQGAATPHPSFRWRAPRPARRWAVAQCSRAVDSDNSVPRPDASAAKNSSAVSPLRCARRPRPTARTDGEFPHNLAGRAIAVGFELCQAARFHPILDPLFWRRLGARFFAYDTQKGLTPHRQGHVPIPACPRAHFVVVQAHLTFGRLNTFFDRPARSSHPHQFSQARMRSGEGDIPGHLTRVADAAAKEQPALPALLRRIAQLHAQPIVDAWSFTARASAESRPALSRQIGQNRLDLALLVVQPDRLFARDRQDIRLLALLQPPTQRAIIAIHTIARQEGQHHACVERALQHLARQGWFGRKRLLVRDTGSTTALAIVGPFFWQIELAIEQGVTLRTGVGQKDADLAVLDPSGGSAILTRHTCRMDAFLEKASFVNHTYSSRVGQIVNHIGSQTVAQGIGIPIRPAKQVLKD